jgi:glutamate dehydrogenase (NADP+)
MNGNDDRQPPRTLSFLDPLRRQYAHQPVFLQAVEEMALSLQNDGIFDDPVDGEFYRRAFLAMTEPERTVSFKVSWVDDRGQLCFNRGWRVEFNRYESLSVFLPRVTSSSFSLSLSHTLSCPSPRICDYDSALGPYKGGLRFHPSVDEGVLKFLAFEQIFKNALTGLPLGAGKGGSDFDPKGKSDAEVRRFCQSFMTELCRYLHPSTDVPAGDIGVGGREIGYLYGQYKRLTNRHGDGGVLTGKSVSIGGSHVRPEATGFGLVYMAREALRHRNQRSLEGMQCAVSGSGNVAQYACRKLLDLGAKVLTVSDSNGVLLFEDGMTESDWQSIMECKNMKRGRLSSLVEGDAAPRVSGKYVPGRSPWNLEGVLYDLALPCATQNEIDEEAARRLVENGSFLGVVEGANLPTTLEGQDVLRRTKVLYIPGKASNAGGVGVSGLEMSQNAQRLTWTPEEVDRKLQEMMSDIYEQMAKAERSGGTLEQGANRVGFLKVVWAMKDLGWIY